MDKIRDNGRAYLHCIQISSVILFHQIYSTKTSLTNCLQPGKILLCDFVLEAIRAVNAIIYSRLFRI